MSNIIMVDYERNGVKHTPIFKNADLFAFVSRAARTFPEWKFVGETSDYNYDRVKDEAGNETIVYHVTRVNVVDDVNTHLGEIYVSSWSKSQYVVDNERIRMKRERGSGAKSASIDKAIANMRKYFTDFTLPEKLSRSISVAVDYLDDEVRHQAYQVRNKLEKISNAVVSKLHWNEPQSTYERIRPLLIGIGLNASEVQALDELPENNKLWRERRDLMDAWHADGEERKASFVYLDNSRYVFVHKDDKANPVILETESLSPTTKETLGLLKLMPDKTFLAGRGYRAAENMFIIFDEKEISNV